MEVVALRRRVDESEGLDQRTVKWVFILATLLGSSLLFLVQPMAARLILPVAGGSSAVWNSAMVFFQLTLLAAYLFSHAAGRMTVRPHVLAQAALLIAPLLLVLPIGLPAGWVLPAESTISLWVLGTLAVMVGLPFFAVSTSSPTLQHWFAKTNHPDAADPYFLYAAGNVGSVLALVAYPLAVEPLLTLTQQGWLWAGVYACFVVASVLAGLTIIRAAERQPDERNAAEPAHVTPSVPWRRRLTWVFWSAVPSALLLGVTNYITTDLASFPLLWVVPLLAYLLSFVLVFGSDAERLVRWARVAVLLGGAPLALLVVLGVRWLVVSIVFQILWFFAAAVMCHGRLAVDRPGADRLTEFYVAMSVGGALGGTLTVLLAPLVFATVAEYPIAIAMVFLIVPAESNRRLPIPVQLPAWSTAVAVALTLLVAMIAPRFAGVLLLGAAFVAAASLTTMRAIAVAVGGIILFPQIASLGDSLYSSRTSFGVYRVTELESFQALVVGTTVHGTQHLDRMDEPVATSYYHPNGPIGQIFQNVDQRSSVGVIGLGAGTLAVWGRPGDTYHFFEIDQEVVDIATNEEFFTYLATSDAEVQIEVVDGRLGVAQSRTRFDILVVDAFSSDAIPIHLITLEAVETYIDRLEPDGIVVFNISNRHFDLEPVLGRVAEELGLTGRILLHEPDENDTADGAVPSRWVALSRSPASVEAATGDNGWTSLRADGSLWTDDYSFVVGALAW